jgi:hypothetical protein
MEIVPLADAASEDVTTTIDRIVDVIGNIKPLDKGSWKLR